MNRQIRRLIFGFLILCGGVAMSYGANNKFKVRFELIKGQAEQIKNELDYKLARSLDFCRGHYIATRKTKWNCSKKTSCEALFKCSNVTKGFTRDSEQKRLGKKLVKSDLKNEYRIYVSKRPIGTKVKAASRKLVRAKKIVPAKVVTKPIVFEDEGIELFNDDNSSEKTITTSAPEATVEEDLNSLLEDEDAESAERTEVGDKILDEVADAEAVSTMNKETRMNWLSFTLQYISTKDDETNSYSSFGLSYTPTFKLSKSIYLRGEFGVHKFSIAETTFTESESFLVTSYLAHLDYVFSNGFYITGGYGKQGWGSESLGNVSFTKLNYGGGYRFKEKLIKYIDRAFLTLASLSSADSTVSATEMQLGLGFSF